MATSSMMSMLECSVCLDAFDDPRMLPCGHTFCLPCLHQLVDTIRAPNQQPCCSLCRTQWNVPQDGIEVLPKNFVVEGLQAQLQIIKKHRDGMAGQLTVLRQTTDNLSRDLAESKANEIEAQTEAAHCKEKLDKLRTSHETVQKQVRAEIETLQKQVNNMQCINDKALQNLAASERCKVKALTNVDRCQDKIDKLTATINQLTSELGNSRMEEKKARSDINELNMRLDTFKQNNNKLLQYLEYSKSQLVVAQAQFKLQLEEKEVLAKQLEASRDTENQTRRKLEEVQDVLDRTKLEAANLETQNTNYRNTIEAKQSLYNICIMEISILLS